MTHTTLWALLPTSGRRREIVPALLLLILMAIFFSFNLGGSWIRDDEGQYLYEAWRIRLGEVPYRDFMTAQMPLFLYFGALIQWMAGPTGMPFRAATVLTGLATAGALWVLGRRTFGPRAALLALIPFAVNDSVYGLVRDFRADPYMMLGATIGLTVFITGLPGQPGLPRRRAFAWAGFFFGLAAGFKLFGLFSAGGCILYLLLEAWLQRRTRRAPVPDRSLSCGQAQGTVPHAGGGATADACPGRQARENAPHDDVIPRSAFCDEESPPSQRPRFLARRLARNDMASAIFPGLAASLSCGQAQGAGRTGWLGDVLAFGTPLAATLLVIAALFMALSPSFLERVLGHHLHQGSDLTLLGVLQKNVRFFGQYVYSQWLFLLLTALGVPIILRERQPRALAILCQVPTMAAFLLISRPLGERHLVYVFPALSLIWAAGLIEVTTMILSRAGLRRGLRRAGLVGVIALAVASLIPYAQRDLPHLLEFERDTPGLVALIQRASPPGAVVVSDYQGLNFFAQRPGTYSSAGISTGAARSGQITAARLIREIEESQAHMVVLDFGTTAGRLSNLPDFGDLYSYVQANFALIAIRPWGYPAGVQLLEFYSKTDLLPQYVRVSFEDRLALAGHDLTSTETRPGSRIPVTLRWQGLTALPVGHSASLKLVDNAGNMWAQTDGEITVLRYRPRWFGTEPDPLRMDRWRPGQTTLQPLALLIRPEVPPGDYQVTLSVYETQSQRPLTRVDEEGRVTQAYTPKGSRRLDLGHIHITRPQPPVALDDLPIARRLSAQWGPLELVGSGPLPPAVRPGDRIHFSLFWHARQAPSADYQARVALSDRQGTIQGEVVLPLAGEGNPSSTWSSGEVWEGQYTLSLNPDIASGEHELAVTVIDQAGAALGPLQTVATLAVAGRQRLFELPQRPQREQQVDFGGIARLLGYDLTASVESARSFRADAGTLSVTLYWQALSTAEVSYTVFVHLLGSDGSVITQHDGQPQEGTSPTTGWLPGEIIVDPHLLEVPASVSLDQARLEIGLYNAATLERLPVRDGYGQPAGDVWLIP